MSRVRAFVYFALFCSLLVVGSTSSRANDMTYFTFQDQSQITISGSSTIRDWKCRGPDVRGYLRVGVPPKRLRASLNMVHELMANRESADWATLASRVSLRVSGPPRVRAAIPVRSMNCGNDAMNEDMYEALKAQRQPALLYELYRLQKVVVKAGVSHRDGLEYELQTTGAMAIAGRAKTIELTLIAHQMGSDTFHFQGEKKLKMSDFDITPPTAFFGLIRAYDSLTIHFDLTMEIRHDKGPPDVRVADRELRDLDYDAWLK